MVGVGSDLMHCSPLEKIINAKNCDNVYNAHLQIYVYQNKPLNDRWIRVGPPTLKGSRSWPSP